MGLRASDRKNGDSDGKKSEAEMECGRIFSGWFIRINDSG